MLKVGEGSKTRSHPSTLQVSLKIGLGGAQRVCDAGLKNLGSHTEADLEGLQGAPQKCGLNLSFIFYIFLYIFEIK